MRAILARSGVERDRVILSNWTSIDWQSLTFIGERHEVEFRIIGSDPEQLAALMADGLPEAEFAIPGQIVADIALSAPALRQANGSVLLSLEALTIAE